MLFYTFVQFDFEMAKYSLLIFTLLQQKGDGSICKVTHIDNLGIFVVLGAILFSTFTDHFWLCWKTIHKCLLSARRFTLRKGCMIFIYKMDIPDVEFPEEVIFLLAVYADEVCTSTCTVVICIIPGNTVWLWLKLYLKH